MSGNSVFPGADPHAMVSGGKVWVYPTHDDGQGNVFYTVASKDFITWQRHGPILRFSDVKWIKDDGRDEHYAWAPCIIERDGKFYFYYSVGNQQVTPSRIGVAVGDKPEGPFVDSGKPLLTGAKRNFEAIDPMVFHDAKSDKYYLYAGGSDGAKLRVFEMNPDMISFAREVEVETPEKFTEGAFMHERQGVYYFTYSHGRYRDSSYSVHYSTAPTPTGPWTYRGVILTSDQTRKGPGHHSIINVPGTDTWFIVYHRWENQAGDNGFKGMRQTAIDRLTYDADGLIVPVVMTDTGVPATSFAPPAANP